MTRREALKILEMAGMEDAEERRLFSPFPDVSVNDPDLWAFLHAVWCGIIEPAGSLQPEEPLTREEAALWLVNLIRNEEKMTESPHQIDQAAVTQDLILAGTGNGNSSRPGEPITWGELAVMITRAVPYLN